MGKREQKNLYVFPDPVGFATNAKLLLELQIGEKLVAKSLIGYPLREQSLKFENVDDIDLRSAFLNAQLSQVMVLANDNWEKKEIVKDRAPCEFLVSLQPGNFGHHKICIGKDGDQSVDLTFLMKDEAILSLSELEDEMDLTKPQMYRLGAAFKFCDSDGDGIVSSSDLKRSFAIIGHELTTVEISDLETELQSRCNFESFVKNFGPIFRQRVRRRLDERKIDELRRIFAVCDLDGNGQIDKIELEAVLWKLGQRPEESDIEKFMKRFDTNQDGAIDLPEFIRGFETFEPAAEDFRSFSAEKLFEISQFIMENDSTTQSKEACDIKESNTTDREALYGFLDTSLSSLRAKSTQVISKDDIDVVLKTVGIDEAYGEGIAACFASPGEVKLNDLVDLLEKVDFSSAKEGIDYNLVEGMLGLVEIADLRFKKHVTPTFIASPIHSAVAPLASSNGGETNGSSMSTSCSIL